MVFISLAIWNRVTNAGPQPAESAAMVASIAKIVSPAEGVTYYERDGYYAKDDPEHCGM